ncbi:MAG: hypothetical protein WC554_16985 [Clostridia bacterium]
MLTKTSSGTGAIVRTTNPTLTGAKTDSLVITALTDGKIPYHKDDTDGLVDGPVKTDVDSAVSLKHAALTIDGTSPLSLSGQALSLKNDDGNAITSVDTDTLANSDTLIPTSKAVLTKCGLYLPLAGGTMSGDIAMASGKGIDFSAGSNAAGKTSEILNDYEEGTWSPVFVPEIGNFTTMTMYTEAAYRKIGKLVFISALIATNNVNVAGASGYLYVSGLPFTAAAHSSLALSYAVFWPGAHPCSAVAYGTMTVINVYKRSAADGELSSVQVNDLQTGEYAIRNRIYISGSYPVSA